MHRVTLKFAAIEPRGAIGQPRSRPSRNAAAFELMHAAGCRARPTPPELRWSIAIPMCKPFCCIGGRPQRDGGSLALRLCRPVCPVATNTSRHRSGCSVIRWRTLTSAPKARRTSRESAVKKARACASTTSGGSRLPEVGATARWENCAFRCTPRTPCWRRRSLGRRNPKPVCAFAPCGTPSSTAMACSTKTTNDWRIAVLPSGCCAGTGSPRRHRAGIWRSSTQICSNGLTGRRRPLSIDELHPLLT